jgi:hypothetical protein
LEIDGQGVVHAVRASSHISVEDYLTPSFGWSGALAHIVLEAIVNGLFGSQLASTVDDQLNFEENVESRFAIQFVLGNISARFRDVVISPNGVFFNGRLAF